MLLLENPRTQRHGGRPSTSRRRRDGTHFLARRSGRPKCPCSRIPCSRSPGRAGRSPVEPRSPRRQGTGRGSLENKFPLQLAHMLLLENKFPLQLAHMLLLENKFHGSRVCEKRGRQRQGHHPEQQE